ncbi:hypothetical protein [Hymenobacter latericus]|uniref:hypothetical protein n=1 Tax=Hymenobacter sp. YIM 151858-1 TaxID=2987688 RepID=UPI002226BAA3|nr:hypothetical protein [Hymenobacter sp. YIM 151858-1]UYZ60151.1 hypothetical protein OIS50_04950 [Hymenobacter sp. YIM 151858-1]
MKPYLHLKTSKPNRKGYCPVLFVKNDMVLATGFTAHPNAWDAATGRITNGTKEAKQANNFLNFISTRAQQLLAQGKSEEEIRLAVGLKPKRVYNSTRWPRKETPLFAAEEAVEPLEEAAPIAAEDTAPKRFAISSSQNVGIARYTTLEEAEAAAWQHAQLTSSEVFVLEMKPLLRVEARRQALVA